MLRMRTHEFACVVWFEFVWFGWYFCLEIHVKISRSESKGYAFDIIIKSKSKYILWHLHRYWLHCDSSGDKRKVAQKIWTFVWPDTRVYLFRQKSLTIIWHSAKKFLLCASANPFVSFVWLLLPLPLLAACHFLLFNLFFITAFRHSLMWICSFAFTLNNY